jgi:hypothetical protein
LKAVIEITLVARTSRIDKDYNHSFQYTNQRDSGDATYYMTFGPYNDRYHRSVLSTQVKCRNLGL